MSRKNDDYSGESLILGAIVGAFAIVVLVVIGVWAGSAEAGPRDRQKVEPVPLPPIEYHTQRWTHGGEFFATSRWEVAPFDLESIGYAQAFPLVWTEEGVHASQVYIPPTGCFRIRSKAVSEVGLASDWSNTRYVGTDCPDDPPVPPVLVPSPPRFLTLAAGVWTLFWLARWRGR